MKRYRDHNNRFGDLARDMVKDKSFPKRIPHTKDEYLVIKRYLENRGACDNAMDTFVDARYEYNRLTLY